MCYVGRRLALLMCAVGLGSSVLATSAAPQTPDRRATRLTEGAISQFTKKDAERAARRIVRRLESLYGQKLKVPIAFLLDQPLVEGALAETGPARRNTQGDWQFVEDDPMKGCLIKLAPEFPVKGKPFVGELAHEITHCFQLQTVTVPAARHMYDNARWVVEGSAEWAGYKYVGNGWGKTGNWSPYITKPEKGLFIRWHDAVGFFGHVGRRANAWRVNYAMWREWRKDVNDRNPFLVAQRSSGKSQAAQDRFLQSWAMSYARRPDLGGDWRMVGPGILGPTVKASPTKVSIGRFGLSMHTLDDASVKLLHVDVAPGLVIRVSPTGFGAIRWLSTKVDTRFARESHFDYCINICTCPPEETLDPNVKKVRATSALIALTGGAGPGFLAIRVRSAAEVCVPGTTTSTGPDPCIYSVDEATSLIAARVGGHHPVEDVDMQFFRTAPPIPPHIQPPKRAVTACLYISSFGDAIWVDRLVDGSLWISYIGYPRDEVLSGTGCC